jgi:hypothetical protein
MRAFIPISALAIALAAGSATAGGNDRQSGSTAQFESLDRNHDQRLSQSEAATDESLSGRFAALDVDSDGYVTKREYAAHMGKDQQDRKTQRPLDESQRQPMPDNQRDPY